MWTYRLNVEIAALSRLRLWDSTPLSPPFNQKAIPMKIPGRDIVFKQAREVACERLGVQFEVFKEEEQKAEAKEQEVLKKENSNYSIKQVIVMRKFYLNDKGEKFQIRKGKSISQACHSSMSFITRNIDNIYDDDYDPNSPNKDYPWPLRLSDVEVQWMRSSFAKVVLSVDTEEELLDLKKKAENAGLVVHLVTDSGTTEFNGIPTNTCIAIGPDYSEKIDLITGHLKLL